MIYIEKALSEKDPFLIKGVTQKHELIENINSINESCLNGDIILKRRKNSFIIPYQYGHGITGKNEYVLRWGTGCKFSCLYCYVQQKINFTKILTVFADTKAIKEELQELFKIKKKILLNAGENFDSFICEKETGFTSRLTNMFSDFPELTVEYRTKSLIPENYINNVNSQNTFIAISLNPYYINKRFEKGTSDHNDRIQNIKALLDKGHRLALRIEPVILIDDYLNHYKKFFRQLSAEFDINRLESIDISLLRLTKKGFNFVKKNREIMSGEWILSTSDNKYRYFIRQRIIALKELKDALSKVYKGSIYIGGEPKNLLKYMI